MGEKCNILTKEEALNFLLLLLNKNIEALWPLSEQEFSSCFLLELVETSEMHLNAAKEEKVLMAIRSWEAQIQSGNFKKMKDFIAGEFKVLELINLAILILLSPMLKKAYEDISPAVQAEIKKEKAEFLERGLKRLEEALDAIEAVKVVVREEAAQTGSVIIKPENGDFKKIV